MKVYVVTYDNEMWEYGAQIYLAGVFKDRSEAQKYIDIFGKCKITEVVIDKPYGYADHFYLGGYSE